MNLVKFTSAALAMTMAFSFSPVFAADESSNPEDILIAPTAVNDPNDQYYVYGLGIKEDEVVKVIKNEGEVKKIIEEAGFNVPNGAEIILLGANDYYVIDKSTGMTEDINTLFNLSVDILPFNDYYDTKDGDTLYVLHLKHDGSWEVVEGVVKDSILTVTLDGLSPVAFYKIMKDGKVIKLTKEEAEQEAAHPGSVVSVKPMNTVRRSPNTGI